MEKIKEGMIQKQPDYPDTLKAIPVGQARKFNAFARTVNSMRNAAFRLNKAGIGEWNIEIIDDHTLVVTRTA